MILTSSTYWNFDIYKKQGQTFLGNWTKCRVWRQIFVSFLRKIESNAISWECWKNRVCWRFVEMLQSVKAYVICHYLWRGMHINICMPCIYLSHIGVFVYTKPKAKVNHKYAHLSVLTHYQCLCSPIHLCVHMCFIYSTE